MRIEAGPARKRSPVSLTPLIDVVFILLVFFMLASSFVEWRALNVSTPAARTQSVETDRRPWRLTVEPGGTLTLNGTNVSVGEAVTRIQGDRDRPVAVIPKGELELQALVSVLDRLSAAGVRASLVDG